MDSFVFVHDGEQSEIFYDLQLFFQSIGIFLYDYRLVLPQTKNRFSAPLVFFLTNLQIARKSQEMEGKNFIFFAYEKDKEIFSDFGRSIFYIQNKEEIIPFLLHEFSLTDLLPYYELYQKYQASSFYHSFYSIQEENSQENTFYLEELLKLVPSNPYLIYAYAYLESTKHEHFATPLFLNAYVQNRNLKEALFQLFKMYPSHSNKIFLEEKCKEEIYRYYLSYTLAPFSDNPLKEYQRCIKENTNFYPAYFKSAFLYDKKNNYYEAKKNYKKVLKILVPNFQTSLFPHDMYYVINAYYRLYLLYLKEGNEVDANKMKQKLKTYPKFNENSFDPLITPMFQMKKEHSLLLKEKKKKIS